MDKKGLLQFFSKQQSTLDVGICLDQFSEEKEVCNLHHHLSPIIYVIVFTMDQISEAYFQL